MTGLQANARSLTLSNVATEQCGHGAMATEPCGHGATEEICHRGAENTEGSQEPIARALTRTDRIGHAARTRPALEAADHVLVLGDTVTLRPPSPTATAGSYLGRIRRVLGNYADKGTRNDPPRLRQGFGRHTARSTLKTRCTRRLQIANPRDPRRSRGSETRTGTGMNTTRSQGAHPAPVLVSPTGR